VSAATIAKYARSAQHVLAILKRLGGTEFQEAFGGLVCLTILSTPPYESC
jgi:hypothetical protein